MIKYLKLFGYASLIVALLIILMLPNKEWFIIELFTRTTNVNLNFTELTLLNELMQQYIKSTQVDKRDNELKLKLSKAIYNVARQEFRGDKRRIDYDNKKTINDIMAGWVNQSTKQHAKWLNIDKNNDGIYTFKEDK